MSHYETIAISIVEIRRHFGLLISIAELTDMSKRVQDTNQILFDWPVGNFNESLDK